MKQFTYIFIIFLFATCQKNQYVIHNDPFISENYVNEIKYYDLNYLKLYNDSYSNNFENFVKKVQVARWKEAMELLNDPDISENDKHVYNAVLYFFKKKYNTSYSYLIKVQDINKYSCNIKLIQADCIYELKKQNDTLVSNINVMQKYQEVLDCSPIEKSMQLVKNRIKIMNYEDK